MNKLEESRSLTVGNSIAEQGVGIRKRQAVRNFHITLKQWKMLHAVVDCGGFSDAAEYLHISQSAISYTIAKLQEQLGIPVLRLEGRKAQLTEAGRALLERSRHLVRDAIELELFAENLRHGWGSDVRLVVDNNFPTNLLMAALRKVSHLGSNIRVSLSEVSMLHAERALFERTADLAITTHVPSGFHGSPLIELEYVAVAHPDYPLFDLGREIIPADLERHVQILIADSKDERHGGSRGGQGPRWQCWNVNNFDTAVEALCEGMGYAWLPKHRVEKWVENEKLKALPIHQGRTYKTYLYLICGHSMMPGSGASVFADLLRRVAAGEK